MKRIIFTIVATLALFKESQAQPFTCATGIVKCDECTVDNGTVCDAGACVKRDPTPNPGEPERSGGSCDCPTNWTDDVHPTQSGVILGCKLNCKRQCKSNMCELQDVIDEVEVCTECDDETMLLPGCIFPQLKNYISNPDANKAEQKVLPCAVQCSNCENSAENCIAKEVMGVEEAQCTSPNVYTASGSKCTYAICAGQNRNESDKCMCNDGFYDNDGHLEDCIPCSDNCVTCKSATQCLTCKSDESRILNEFTGVCECISGFRVFDASKGCQKCYMLSDVCVEKCPQNTVQNEKLSLCETLEYEMISNATLILVLGVLIAIIQIALCCFVWVCLQRKHDIMEKELLDEQMKIKQQRDHIYKNMENYNASQDAYSKSGTGSPFKSRDGGRGQSRQGPRSRSNMDESQSELSSSNLQSSQVNLFNRGGNQDQSQIQMQQPQDMEDVSSVNDQSQVDGSQVDGSQAESQNKGRRRRRQQNA